MTDTKDAPQIVFFPPLLFFGTLIFAVLLEFLLPLKVLPVFAGNAAMFIGAAIMALAVSLAVSGVRNFKASATNVNPRQPALNLVTGGPYRFTRNPMYLGMTMFQPGAGLAFSLEWSFVLTPLLFAALHYGVVLREETYLSRKFGAPYDEFRASTRRWL